MHTFIGEIMNQSYWQKTTQKKEFPKLNQDIKTDILIIGGGLSGVMLAYQLRNSHFQVTVIDKDNLGSHTSGHTTAKVTVLHDVIYQKINQYYDKQHALLYYQSNKRALLDIKKIIRKEHIDCSYQENIAYLYTSDIKKYPLLEKEKQLLTSFGEHVIEKNGTGKMIGLKNQAVFHPLQYLYAIIDICCRFHVQFYEHSLAKQIIRHHDHYTVKVNDHIVTCRYVVHATRYPFFKKGMYFMKIFQSQAYVGISSKKDSPNSYLSLDDHHSYRPLNDHQAIVINNKNDWFAQDSMPLRGIPYIGRLYQNEFIIYGFQKWGMTLSHVSAQLIKDLIYNNKNPYEELYSCHYFSLSFSKQYFSLMKKNILKGYLLQRYQTVDSEQIERKSGAIIKKNHRLYALYRDENGKDHYFSPYCPHLKCLIHFNSKSQTWSCPCHQSVYDAYGQVLEGPSIHDLKKC